MRLVNRLLRPFGLILLPLIVIDETALLESLLDRLFQAEHPEARRLH